jgi:hypothetical protein
MSYVSFPALGRYGRLGNQLFQIAATFAHARNIGLEPRFPEWPALEHFPFMPKEWFVPGVELEPIDYEAPWNYEPIPTGARRLHGYFQAAKYFEKYRAEIVDMFRVSGRRIRFPNAAHVRRGDYLALPEFHPLPSARYWSDALKLTHGHVAVTSDDPVWCLNNFPAKEMILSRGAGWAFDHKILLDSDVLVMSNSSFSWWPAWLGNHDKIVCPLEWFGPNLADHDVSQLIPKHWIRI